MGRREAIISIERVAKGEDDQRSRKKFNAVIQGLIFEMTKNQEDKNAWSGPWTKELERHQTLNIVFTGVSIEFIV